MKEQLGWFQAGSFSLSFLMAGIIGVIIVTVVYFLVRHLTRRNLAQGGGHH